MRQPPGTRPAARRPVLPSAQVPPAWGWKIPFAGRAAHVAAAPEYQATTTQACGLYPYVAGSGTPAAGTPVGRHQLWGEVVCLDPLAWLRAGLVTNPGEFVLGQPGIGKSTLVKRQITGAVATGTRVLILGDTKPDYTMLTEHLGGQVIRIGRGLDRINPLDAGPLGAALQPHVRPGRPGAALGSPVPAAVAADGPVHPGPGNQPHQRRGSHPRPGHRPARRTIPVGTADRHRRPRRPGERPGHPARRRPRPTPPPRSRTGPPA